VRCRAFILVRIIRLSVLGLGLSAGLTRGEVDFARVIQPVLEGSCVQCHGADKDKGGLRLHTGEALAAGGDSGPAVDVADPDQSLILQRLHLAPDHEEAMPPKDKAPRPDPVALENLRAWVAAGAKWPEGTVLKPLDPESVTAARDGEALVSIKIFPPACTLETKRDEQRIIVMATYADDTTRDVTKKVDFTVGDPSLVRVDGNHFTPLADGESTIRVEFFGQSAEVPLKVVAATAERPVSFRLDVMPVLERGGCNTGSCHGSARGQDGFRLSLFGYNPDDDYFRITRELGSRRINLAIPEDSLLVTKSIGAVPHTGGKRFEADSRLNRTLLEWLEAGVPNDDPAKVARVTGIEVAPSQLVLEGRGTRQQLTVLAKYSDGTDRDVTPLATFITSNAGSAAVEAGGLVTSGDRGEAFVMARFASFTVGTQVIVIPAELQYARPQMPEANYIDTLVHEKLHKLRLLPSGDSTDEVFLRRVFLDTIGLLPTPAEHQAFVSNPAPDKRDRLVDELLARKEFTELWVMKFAELLQIRTNPTNQVSYKSSLLYFNWLQDRIAKNIPFNQIVRELISANGGTFKTPPTNYYQIEKDTLKLTENLAQVFMGMRIQCAQCHNHPFDRWTTDDYYGFAAFFAQIGRKQSEDPRELIVFNSGGGEMKHLVGGRDVKPKFLGGPEPELKPGSDRRALLADWLSSPDNPYFAKNLANILWAHFFGVGIVDPVDDVRISNPATNPELLEELGRKFIAYNYDFKRLVRDITTSKTYQRTTQANESNALDGRNFSRSLIRRQRAEVMLDAISQVTETKNKFQGLPEGARAVQIADGNVSTYFLRTFGRAERASVCSCEVKMEPNLGQALHLLNGDTTHNRIGAGKVVENLLQAGRPPAAVIDDLFVRCFSRTPTPAERADLDRALAEAGEAKRQALEDVFWALLNSKEFMFNH
jgi:mono/diheme cytochrome c family protein